ncbi:MAG TPA: M81 family metallopeptidase [Chloroflexota bacterium]|nr:M81 family metallopeptidase [Chloroflexota bacterium]
MAYRIGVGGIAIESSTFSPHASTLDDFTILRGDELLSRYPFMPGWRFRQRDDLTWLPCLHGRAIPGGPVTAEAYAAMRGELLERVQGALPLDGLYLDVHGAMFVQGMEDAEADLAGALREVLGAECITSGSFDLHGNVSERLVGLVDVLTAYRLAPHDDTMETRERAVAHLVRCLDEGLRPQRAWVRIPAILPGERTSTLVEPGRTVYARLAESDGVEGVLDASLWVGYVWADEPRSAATAVVTGTDEGAIQREAEKIARRYWEARHAFDFVAPAGDADWCIERALELASAGERAIFISDSGDNPTAGGVGDVPYLLERLLAHPAFAGGGRTAIYASIPDPAAVVACAAVGVGGEVEVSLGGKLDTKHGRPVRVRGRVTRLLRDDPVGGDIAVVRRGGVSAIVTSRRKPYHYVRDLLALGLDPAAQHVTAVKIGYLVPDLRKAARHQLLALTPGAVNQDIRSLRYERVPRPVFPLDPEMEWEPEVRVFGRPGGDMCSK